MRKVLLFGGIAVAAVLLAVVALLLLVDVNQFRGPIQAQLQKQLGRPVSLGNMGLRILPLSITVDDVNIGESPAFQTGRPFAAARQIRVSVGLLPLLRKEIHVNSLVLRQPAIELVRNTAGQWNFSELGGGPGSGGGGGGGALVLRELQIEDGRVAVGDLGNRKNRSVYDHIDVVLRDFAPGKKFRVEATVRLPRSGGVKLTADGGPLGSAAAPLAGRVEIQNASLAALESFLSSGSRGKIDGVASGAADFQSAASVLNARGGLELKDLRAGTAELGYPVRLDYKLSHDLNSGVLKASSLEMKVGNVPVSISGEMDTKASTVNAGLKVSEASVAELLALARALGAGDLSGSGVLSLDARVRGPFQKADALTYSGSGALRNASLSTAALTKPIQVRSADLKFDRNTAALNNLVASLGGSTLRGSMSARTFSAPDVGFGLQIDKLDLAELQQLTAPGDSGGKAGTASTGKLTAKGTIDVGSILYNGMSLNRVHSECTLSRGVLTLAPLTAELFGGKQSGSITLDTRPQPPRLALNTKLDGVDANQLLSATTSLKKMIYGLLAASGDVSMGLVSSGDPARTLNGKLNLNLTKGRMAGVNLLNEMANLGKFLGYTQRTEPFTNILQLAGDILVRDGVASTDNLQLKTDGGTVASTGTVNLVDQSINLKLTTVLDRAMSEKVGGSRVGGFLTTALSNSQGELVIPALVTGTFAHPRFAPDAARVAQMKLKSLVPSTANPGGLRGTARSVLDSLSGKPAETPGSNATAKPAETPRSGGVFGILDSLRKKQEQKKQEKQ